MCMSYSDSNRNWVCSTTSPPPAPPSKFVILSKPQRGVIIVLGDLIWWWLTPHVTMPFINHHHPWAIRLLLTPLLHCIWQQRQWRVSTWRLCTILHIICTPPYGLRRLDFSWWWWCCCDDEGCVDWCRFCCCCWLHRWLRGRSKIENTAMSFVVISILSSVLLYILTSVVNTIRRSKR